MYQVESLQDVFFVYVPVVNIRLPLHMDYESFCVIIALGSCSRYQEGRFGSGIDGQAHITSRIITPSNISDNLLD